MHYFLNTLLPVLVVFAVIIAAAAYASAAPKTKGVMNGIIGGVLLIGAAVILIALAWPYVFEAGAQLMDAAAKLDEQDQVLRKKGTGR